MTTPNTTNNAAREAGQLPNYRIYDRTGGGVRQDIYAPSMEDAIERGREWIEDGSWERDEMETPLACCVREIVRVPDLRSIESLPGVYDVTIRPDGVIVATISGKDHDTIAGVLAGVATLATIDGSVMDADGDWDEVVTVTLAGPMPMMIDEAATDHGQEWDCSGICPAKDAPDCLDGKEHDWQTPLSIVGGCRENPGVFGSGHGATRATECCAHCGLVRTTDYGATFSSNGQKATRISYDEDNEAAKEWAAKGVQS